MPKIYNLRLSRVITSFNVCRSKNDNEEEALKHDVDGCCRNLSQRRHSPKHENCSNNDHAMNFTPRRKIDSESGEIFPPLELRRRRRQDSPAARLWPWSNSSTDEDSGWSSSDGIEVDVREDYKYCIEEVEEKHEISTTTDVESSDNNASYRRRHKVKIGGRRRNWRSTPDGAALVRRLMPCAAPAVSESFAVVKESDDPVNDFRRSMAEMVVEKEIYDGDGLENLLHCFLSLNSRRHHKDIVVAFEDVWDTVFCCRIRRPAAKMLSPEMLIEDDDEVM